ncbi:hypothetical protein M1512_01030 [Patescibacteria group bacterium]|nr:hypothetical protein [Patescibacteria group bacterium]
MSESDIKVYRVALKGGQWSYFPNDGKLENYPNILQSGVYQILWHDGNYYPINPQTLSSIKEIEPKEEP